MGLYTKQWSANIGKCRPDDHHLISGDRRGGANLTNVKDKIAVADAIPEGRKLHDIAVAHYC